MEQMRMVVVKMKVRKGRCDYRGWKISLPALLACCCCALVPLISGEVRLGGMESWGFNGVRTGPVSLISSNKLRIRELDYTGEGPAVWFMVGKEEEPYNQEFAELKGTIIPDENGSCRRLQRYRNENVVLTLPKGMNFTDYDYLAIYCTRFNHNFGFVQLKRDANPDQMKPMDPLEKRPKPCPQDHLEDDDGDDDAEEDKEKEKEKEEEEEEEEEEDEEDDTRRKKLKKAINKQKAKKSGA